MKPSRGPIRVLVVDDSQLAREMVAAILSDDPEITVAGWAANGLEAVAKTASLKPDIVIMDIEMPVMDGLAAIEAITAKSMLPILVLTSHTGVRVAFDAVSRGALDVMEKPDLDADKGARLIRKVKLLARVDVARLRNAGSRPSQAPAPEIPPPDGSGGRIVAIASSTGGPRALEHILSNLPAGFPAPIVISQHVADGFADGMAEWLDATTPLKVSAAKKGDLLLPGHAYLNPSGANMKITRDGVIMLLPSAPDQVYHPSCDVMLGHVAASFGSRAVGVILTGMGDDGVQGMKAIKEAGGVTIAQDEETSIVYGMNAQAVKRGCVDTILPLSKIPAHLVRLAGHGA